MCGDDREQPPVTRRDRGVFQPVRLQAAIEAWPHTIYELARLSGVSRQTIANWVSGDAAPSIDKLGRVCEVLTIPIGDVLDIDPDNANLADLRSLAALTRLQLGTKAGLPTSVVQDLEQGTARLMPHHITKLAAALGVDDDRIRRAYHATRTRRPGAPP